MRINLSVPTITALIPILTLLSACGGSYVALDTPAHHALIAADVETAAGGEAAGQVYRLSVEDALERALHYNLDARVSALETLTQQDRVTLEKLKALPSVKASAGYQGRSNDGATSSRSVLSGQQSLEPSQSTQEDRQVADMTFSWNMLDAVMAFVDAKTADDQAKIALERQRKVMQNIERDVYSAYWRAAASQQTREETVMLLGQAQKQMESIRAAADQKLISRSAAADKVTLLSERQRNLRDLYNQLALADIELKSLLSLPLSSTLVLEPQSAAFGNRYQSLLTADMNKLIDRALKSRPEMREAVVQKNISARETAREVYTTLPGVEALLSLNFDSNQFLEDKTWSNTSLSIVQSVIDLVTLPSRYEKAQTREALGDSRRRALAAAIMAQTHIAQQRLVLADKDYAAASAAHKTMQAAGKAKKHEAEAGMTSGESALLTSLAAQAESLRAQMAYAKVQDAYAAFVNTLGEPLSGRGTM